MNNFCLKFIILIILTKSNESFNINQLKTRTPLNIVKIENISPQKSEQKLSIIYLPEEEANAAEEETIKNNFYNNDQLNKRTNTRSGQEIQTQNSEIFTRMRSICARMPRLKRKRTPKPGSPESLVAFLCSSANIF
ncbi:hypothetical protein ACQ4LE_001649 [Meloidogyne hapla]